MLKNYLISILVTLSLLIPTTPSHASTGWMIYYEGSFKGKIIDAETKEHIEGAVVVAEYHGKCLGLGHGGSVTLGVQETLTDKKGEFYLWPKISFFLPWCWGGSDSYTTFTIFKPGYESVSNMFLFNGPNTLNISAIGPSTIEYFEEHKQIIGGQEVTDYVVKKTKTYSEGLIYTGKGCKERMDSLKKLIPFSQIDYIYTPMDMAIEKIKKMDVPLDCPRDGEPVPHADRTMGFRNDVERHVYTSFAIIELSKLKTRDERLNAIPGGLTDYGSKELPLLYKTINEENKNLGIK